MSEAPEEKMVQIPTDRPKVELLGEDGNAFAIMGRCQYAARRAGWTKEQIGAVLTEMKSGDYNHLLTTAMNYFTEASEDDEEEFDGQD